LRAFLVSGLVALWGLRLATHIGLRLRKSAEDKRYVEMRKKWTRPKLQAYTNVFLLQGFFMFLVVSPVVVGIAGSSDIALSWFNWIGLGIWIIGFFFESVGDYQLKKFLKNKHGHGSVMRLGLWRYSRHPNYFGEITQWWGIWILTLFVPVWYIGIIGPMVITALILGLSGGWCQ
jgi:steroid 5-alpha reductase family enzyme